MKPIEGRSENREAGRNFLSQSRSRAAAEAIQAIGLLRGAKKELLALKVMIIMGVARYRVSASTCLER